MAEMQSFFNLHRAADSANGNVLVFTSEDLKSFTNNFNGTNLIGITQFGRFYRGKLRPSWAAATEAQNVTVKIWDQNMEFLIQDVKLSMHPSLNGHPCLGKLIGYCCGDEVKGVVYDFNPLGSLQNFMARDDFNWLQRVDVILELARLLNYIHSQEKQSLAFEFRASNILLDWECKPKLCGFGLISSNGSDTDLNKLHNFAQIPNGCFHPTIGGTEFGVNTSESQGEMSSDVYSLGKILLGLIAKIDFEPEKLESQNHHGVVNSLVSIWAKNEYQPNASLVHETLQKDWGYHADEGVKLTELAMHSLDYFPRNRPSIEQILQRLEGLQVTQRILDTRPRKKVKQIPYSAMDI